MLIHSQLASNFTSFFEKLVDLLEDLQRVLPQYKELLENINSEPSPRLRLSIQAFYVDLFHLFQAVVQVFTKRSGSTKPAVPSNVKQVFGRADTDNYFQKSKEHPT